MQVEEDDGLAKELSALAASGKAAAGAWETHVTGFKPATFVAAANIAWSDIHDFDMVEIGGYMNAQRKRIALTNEELHRFIELDKYAVMMHIDASIPSHLPTVLESVGISSDGVGDVFVTPGSAPGSATGAFLVITPDAAEIAKKKLPPLLGCTNSGCITIMDWDAYGPTPSGQRLSEEEMRPLGCGGGGRRRLSETPRSTLPPLADDVARQLRESPRSTLPPDGVADGVADDGELWMYEWGDRIACWWEEKKQTPLRSPLVGCATQLGEHLGQKLSEHLGLNPRIETQPRIASANSDTSCDWITKDLLELPSFPGAALPKVPALPALLPWGLQKWQELGEEQAHTSSLPAISPAISPVSILDSSVQMGRAGGAIGGDASGNALATVAPAMGGFALAGLMMGMAVTFGITRKSHGAHRRGK